MAIPETIDEEIRNTQREESIDLLGRCRDRQNSREEFCHQTEKLDETYNRLKEAFDVFSDVYLLQDLSSEILTSMEDMANRYDLMNLIARSEVNAARKEVKRLLQLMYDKGMEVPTQGRYIDYTGLNPQDRQHDALHCVSHLLDKEKRAWSEWMAAQSEETQHELRQYKLSGELLDLIRKEDLDENELASLIDWIVLGNSINDKDSSGETKLQGIRFYGDLESLMGLVSPAMRRVYLKESLPWDVETATGIDGIEKLFRFLLLMIDKLRSEKESSSFTGYDEDLPFMSMNAAEAVF